MTNFNLNVKSSDLEFGSLIDTFLATPLRANLTKPGALVDALTGIFIGTSQTRYGPAPSPEVTVSIRDVLRTLTERKEPIRVLSPWGTKKPVMGHFQDIGEVAAWLQMRRLQEEVRTVYEPGIVWQVAVEDAGGYFIRRSENEQDPAVFKEVKRYTETMEDFPYALGMADWATVKLETTYPRYGEFDDKAEALAQRLYQHFNGYPNAMQDAERLGWRGDVPQEMMDFYLNSYRKNRPGDMPWAHLMTLARYLAQANTRYQLGMKAPEWWGDDYLQVNFPQPVPGAPDHLTRRRLFYRTMPAKHTNNHMPPWRAKGFLCINSGSRVQFKMTNWHDLPESLIRNMVTIDGARSITVEADYVLRDGGEK